MQLEPTTHALYWQAFKVGIVGGMELVERPNVYTTAIAMFAAIRAECGDGEMSERASERAFGRGFCSSSPSVSLLSPFLKARLSGSCFALIASV